MRRPIIFILLAGLGAILAAIVVFSALKNRESEVQRAMAHTVEVVVVSRDIPLGEKLQADSVKLVRWAREGVPQGAFTDPNASSAPSPKASSSPTSPWSLANSSWARRLRA